MQIELNKNFSTGCVRCIYNYFWQNNFSVFSANENIFTTEKANYSTVHWIQGYNRYSKQWQLPCLSPPLEVPCVLWYFSFTFGLFPLFRSAILVIFVPIDGAIRENAHFDLVDDINYAGFTITYLLQLAMVLYLCTCMCVRMYIFTLCVCVCADIPVFYISGT